MTVRNGDRETELNPSECSFCFILLVNSDYLSYGANRTIILFTRKRGWSTDCEDFAYDNMPIHTLQIIGFRPSI